MVTNDTVSEMADRYTQFAGSPPGKFLVKQLGLPSPKELRRYEPGQDLLDGPALIGGAPGGRLAGTVARVLGDAGAEWFVHSPHVAKAAKVRGAKRNDDGERRYAALVYDATGIATSGELHDLYAFFHGSIARLAPFGRLIVLGTAPADAAAVPAKIAARALEGFTRSAAKEVRAGATAQLVYVAPGAEDGIEGTLRFLLSARSAFVSGQVVRIGQGATEGVADWEHPLAGKVALVTGASRGIGESIAETLARDGAHVVCLDIPAAGEALTTVANRIGGSSLQLDITAPDAPERLVAHLTERHGGVDVVVHNAGVTKDRTLARMTDEQWDVLMAINLTAQERLTDALLESGALREHGRIASLSSMNGIAGQKGQANYATSKAGIIGFVEAMAPVLAERNVTVNAVAPGFIETQMTAAMPIATREAGRRMNSLSQGGLPRDVAETIAWLASPASGGVTGNTIRVDGQHLVGA
jgi:3-oxoacyl-[acyl-carrier protein] reductase